MTFEHLQQKVEDIGDHHLIMLLDDAIKTYNDSDELIMKRFDKKLKKLTIDIKKILDRDKEWYIN